MIRKLTVAALLLLVVGGVFIHGQKKKVYPERWVYVSRSLRADKDVEEIREIARTSAEHGLTAIVLTGFDRIDLQPPAYFERLKKVKEICDNLKLEVIPSGFNTGYGGALLSHDRNLAAGLPVKGALFVAGKEQALFVSDSPGSVLNGSFEAHQGDAAAKFPTQAEPGKLTFVDTAVAHDGKASLRFENFGTTPTGGARIEQVVRVTPYREYRVRVWVRTEGAQPARLFSVRAYAPDRRNLSYYEPELKATADWQEEAFGFNSWYAEQVRLSIGIDEGKAGKVWIDDVRLEEIGLTNVVRREGTPVVVRNEKDGTVYEENRDYAPIADPKTDFLFAHDGPPIRLPAGSRIHDGDRLRVDYYHGTTIYNDQTPACFSEPKIFEIWAKQFPLIEKNLAPRKYLLNFDEVRAGGFCEACKRRHMSAAQMLGDTITRVYQMIREVNPKAEVFIWSDMLDPNHNARAKYYLVDGDFTGGWNYVPKDLRIACWYFEKRRASLDHFSKLGFQTLAAGYYDADDLKNPQGWLEALDETPGARGIMYTTWNNKYKLLAPFGDLVSKR